MGSQHPHDNENIELQVEEDDDIIDLYYSTDSANEDGAKEQQSTSTIPISPPSQYGGIRIIDSTTESKMEPVNIESKTKIKRNRIQVEDTNNALDTEITDESFPNEMMQSMPRPPTKKNRSKKKKQSPKKKKRSPKKHRSKKKKHKKKRKRKFEDIDIDAQEETTTKEPLRRSKRIKLKEQQAKPYKLRIMDTQNKERCGICGLNEEESLRVPGLDGWIACGRCEWWLHKKCAKINTSTKCASVDWTCFTCV
eukprot:408818_1